MPLEYKIDHDRKLVTAIGRGVLTVEAFFNYQREVWSRADVAGYDEIVDMRTVSALPSVTAEQVQALAALATSMDHPEFRSKLAIVAQEVLHFGLGRMYQSFREMNSKGLKQVAVFVNLDDAYQWLGKMPSGS